MMLLASTWLGLALLLCAFAWPSARLAFALPFAVVAAALAVYLPTGHPRPTAPPPGKYAVLGVDMQQGVEIRVLLSKANGPAVYYRLPWSNSQAEDLQGAMYEAGGEGGISAVFGEEGYGEFDPEPPVTDDETKTSEQPSVELD